MGDDSRTSVVDRNLKVHECPNLYLSGCETFVTGAAVPPVMTIVALAHRLAEHLSTRLRQGDSAIQVGAGAGRL
jgi:choline dehydrogenase-like flavoprotein